MTDDFVVRYDCRRYRGDRPCKPRKVCGGCIDYDPLAERLLVVKLAATGDVLRTTPLLRALKERHPRSWITWITDPGAAVLLRGNPLIDELLIHRLEDLLPLAARRFHWAAVLDKEPRAAALGTLVAAQRKVGFGLDPDGHLTVLNPESLYALRLGLDDRLKFRENTKSYPEIVFEMCGLPWRGEEYVFFLQPEAREAARQALQRAGFDPGRPAVGLNTGAGSVFATKRWSERGTAEVARRLVREHGLQVVLLGGPEERERNPRIASLAGVPLVDPGTANPLDVFAGIVDHCRLVVTTDTLALHLSLALGKEVVLLMGPTSAREIHLYGRGEILLTETPCAPCYRSSCSEGARCLQAITPDRVVEAVLRRLAAARRP